MDISSLIKDLKESLATLEAKGQEMIPVASLKAYINEIEKISLDENQENELMQKEATRAQIDFENKVELAKLHSAHSLAMFQSVIEAGLNALKSSMIINGGAAIALLAFLGGYFKEASTYSGIGLSMIGQAIFIFLLGAGCVGVATGLRYMSQFTYSRALELHHENRPCKFWENIGHIFNGFSVVLALLSYVAFFGGGWTAYQAITECLQLEHSGV